MLTKDRQNEIISWLSENKSAQIPDMAEHFKVSVATIRRDLRDLEQANLVKRVYGGAILYEQAKLLPFLSRASKNKEQKKLLAIAAVGLIKENDSIILDSGTTVLEVAKCIKNIQNLRVITNSIPILNEMDGCIGVKTYCMGGEIQSVSHAMTGSVAESTLAGFCADKAFISASGVSLKYGLSDYTSETAQLSAASIRRAKQVILVVDSSKFDVSGFAVYGNLEDVDVIVTDSGIPQEYRNYFESHGVEVILADEGNI